MHTRSAVRNAIVEMLDNGPFFGSRVYPFRATPAQAEDVDGFPSTGQSELPLCSVNTPSDHNFLDGTLIEPSANLRLVRVQIEFWIDETDESPAELGADNAAEWIEETLGADTSLGGVAANLRYDGTDIDVTDEGSQRRAHALIRYEVLYQNDETHV